MTRINTNVSSLVAQTRLNRTNDALQTSLTRLSTGLRINSGKDDPAGLIASEVLRSDITSINKALTNTQRAGQIIATADGALGQVSSLLNDIRGLVVEAANNGALSADEIAANQLQIDSSLEAINRIAQTTTFQGRKLLDGSLDFVSNLSGISSVTDAKIDQANLGASGSIAVDVEITAAAQTASITAASSAFSTAAAATTSSSTAQNSFTVGTSPDTVSILGRNDATSVVVTVNNAKNATATASYASGVLTIEIDGDSNPSSLTNIAAAVNGVDGFFASINGTAATTIITGSTNAATASTSGLTVTADANGSDYNNVTVKYVSGAADAAAYDPTQKTLTVTLASGDHKFSDIKTLIDAATDGTANTPFTASFTTGHDDLYLNLGNQAVSNASTGSTGGEVLNGSLVFELSGKDGSDVFNFQAGASASQISSAINLVRDATGVTSTVTSGALVFNSTAYGSEALVNLNIITEGTGGTFKTNLNATRDSGTDIVANVNGVRANGSANSFTINTATLDLSLTVSDGSDADFAFTISGGGARFQLGPDVVSTQQARLGIASVSTGRLGGASGRLYELGSGQTKSLTADTNGAARVIEEVINKVTTLRGRLGAFQRTALDSNLVALGETVANLLEAESSIRDADFAKESANLTRAQILVQSGTSVLAIANQNPQNVLSLLR